MGKYNYATAAEWHAAAMLRPSLISDAEIEQRRTIAELHHANQLASGEPVMETPASDQELYILGKMDIEEYQAYLVFKANEGTFWQ